MIKGQRITFQEGLVNMREKFETELGAFMFSGCTALKNFTVAVTCKEICDNCFNGCNELTLIDYEGSLKDWSAIEKQKNWNSLANLTKVQCLDGYLEWDSEKKEWNEVKNNA